MTDKKKYDFKSIVMKDAEWCNHLGFSDFDGLNRIIRAGKAIQLVNLCEARHENQCSDITNDIVSSGAKIVLLAGPSSSGKTSSSLRIGLQCKVHGLNPKTIELDNYFLNKDDTPLLPSGDKDFESLAAMDLDMLNDHLSKLLHGEAVELPRFDFIAGKKVFEGNMMQLHVGDILILEGIHALNPAMTPLIPDSLKYHIFVCDTSSMSNYDPNMETTDNRLLRRMVRDNRTRGINPEGSIRQWPNVREGEDKNIVPFVGNADAVFNTSAQYELPLLKHYVLPFLKAIEENSECYQQAHRLLGILENIDALPVDAINAIPCTSILREFIGGQILSRNLL